MEEMTDRARRVLIRLYSLGDSKASRTDLQFRSGIRFCMQKGWATQDEHGQYCITAEGKKAREGMDDFISRNSSKNPPFTELPPLPYTTVEVGDFVYVADATGQKIANLLGPMGAKRALAKLICEAGQNQTH